MKVQRMTEIGEGKATDADVNMKRPIVVRVHTTRMPIMGTQDVHPDSCKTLAGRPVPYKWLVIQGEARASLRTLVGLAAIWFVMKTLTIKNVHHHHQGMRLLVSDMFHGLILPLPQGALLQPHISQPRHLLVDVNEQALLVSGILPSHLLTLI